MGALEAVWIAAEQEEMGGVAARAQVEMGPCTGPEGGAPQTVQRGEGEKRTLVRASPTGGRAAGSRAAV